MIPDTPGTEQSRRRAGFAILALGIVLLLYAWVSWLVRTSNPEGAPRVEVETRSSAAAAAQSGEDQRSEQRTAFVRAAPTILLATFLLVLVFLAGSYILARGVRRQLAAGDHRRGPPTPSDDLWSIRRGEDDSDQHAA